jgi:hypothetical protein
MSKLAFDSIKKFNYNCTVNGEHDSADVDDSIKQSVVSLLNGQLPKGEVPFTTGFCQDPNVKKLASLQGLGVDRSWKMEILSGEGESRRE